MIELNYNRNAAVEYANRWAMGRNPAYFNFDRYGGDCTNFASQCIYSGSGVMNYTPQVGWYYRSSYDRTASWTGVEYLYNFLISNRLAGPYAIVVNENDALPGDIVQLGDSTENFYHSPVITAIYPEILVAAHTVNSINRPLSSYIYDTARFLHIVGVRKYLP